MQQRARFGIGTALVGLGLAAGLLPGTAAQAAELPKFTETTGTVSAEAVRALTVPGDKADKADLQLQSRMKSYLQDAAARGWFLDARSVKTAHVPDPVSPGKFVDLIWDGNQEPAAVRAQIAEAKAPDASQRTVGEHKRMRVDFQPNAKTASPMKGQRLALLAAGSAFDPAHGNPDLRLNDSGRGTFYFTPGYQSADTNHDGVADGSQMNSSFEDWERDGTPYFYYNRWGTWKPADPIPCGYYCYEVDTYDFSILSRPWSGYRGNFQQMAQVTPAATASTCSDTADLAVTAGAFTLTVPIHRCTTTWSHADFGTMQFGLDWDGYTPDKLLLDSAASFVAINSSVPLYWADQTYAAVDWCDWAFPDACTYTWYNDYKFQDSGW